VVGCHDGGPFPVAFCAFGCRFWGAELAEGLGCLQVLDPKELGVICRAEGAVLGLSNEDKSNHVPQGEPGVPPSVGVGWGLAHLDGEFTFGPDFNAETSTNAEKIGETEAFDFR